MCSCRLPPGNYFYLADDARLICTMDYQRMLVNEMNSESESDESGSDDMDQRMRITDIQLRLLLDVYAKNKRPTKDTRRTLGESTGLKSRTIQIWFQNKRSKDKATQRKHIQRNSGSKDSQFHSMDSSSQNGLDDNNIRFSDNVCTYPSQENPSFSSQNGGSNSTQSMDDNRSTANFEPYQLFCPLDYLLPNEMPPNVDLSSADLCNGEVISEPMMFTCAECGKHYCPFRFASIPRPILQQRIIYTGSSTQ
ncbi:LIM/homeobox protein Lhx3-like [Mya arenaria]|uniref:LIM/homeobox protein Lhx3-like n=1 Tax=Mya arenaria TaxID=6604 RepID=UPI0022DEE158|nr:LIM/homeobox protein Lhx3-like [Mya arenaria]